MPNLQTVIDNPFTRQRTRVPTGDASLLALPSLADTPELIRQNHDSLSGYTIDVQGRRLNELRNWARKELVQAARNYTAEIIGKVDGDAIFDEPFEHVVTGGHQPSLFHPGVWVKNFAIGLLAKRTSGVAVNLVIDNDTISTSRLRVPAGKRLQPVYETVPFDIDRATEPWEEARVLDRPTFESFAHRLSETMARWNIEPLAKQIWPAAVTQLDKTNSLRDCLTASRAQIEQQWGLRNLELPISRLCTLDPFLWFASHLLAQLPTFREVHNSVLSEYRSINRIRSRTHPVPELKIEDGWIEAPFWVWRESSPRRDRLFAKQVDREVHLRDASGVFARLPLAPDMEACCAVEVLRRLPAKGIRLRTRALTTTLFTRLFFSDLFVHGIGGSKYDEMTDRIINRFFKLPAPAFLTLSATLRLPLGEASNVGTNDAPRLSAMLRDLTHNPDRHLNSTTDAETDTLKSEKQTLIAEQHEAATQGLSRRERRLQTRRNYDRFQHFQQINRQLSVKTREQQRQIETELEAVNQQTTANSILTDREYSFCLFPAEKLRQFMASL